MKIKAVECKNLNECFSLKKNMTFFEELIISLNSDLLIKQALSEDPNVMGTDRIKSANQQNKPKKSDLLSNDYEDDYDHNDVHHRHELRPNNFDEIETLDNGVTWAIKAKFQILILKLFQTRL